MRQYHTSTWMLSCLNTTAAPERGTYLDESISCVNMKNKGQESSLLESLG